MRPLIIYGFLTLILACKSSCSSLKEEAVAVEYSSPRPSHYIFQSESFLVLILSFISDRPLARKVSKMFLKCFDDACRYDVIIHDPRMRFLMNLPRNPFTIPLQVPLVNLLHSFVGTFLEESRETLDNDFPNVEIVKGKRAFRLRKRKIMVESNRFIELLNRFMEQTFFNPTVTLSADQVFSPQQFLTFYSLIKAIFAEKDFETEVIPLIHFPIEEFLKNAARGLYPYPLNQELLTEFNDLLPDCYIFEAFKRERLDIVRHLLLLPSGEKMIKTRDERLRRPIHYAAFFGNLELLKLVHGLGEARYVNRVDDKNEKAIHKAAAAGHFEAFKFLVERGSVIGHSSTCKSPIFTAVQHNRLEIVHYILFETTFLSIDTCDFNYKLLKQAMGKNNLEMVSLLRNSPKLHFSEDQITKLVDYATARGF